ncbi:MAG: TAT-variant-translocated molybdopterin oxidoreductase [Flavobacteriales bacterium]|nr:TAT-variant-translocated molybdopterin oxidoreductase [Flavobacteriales bacterium]
MEMNRKYWKGIDELKETPSFIESGNQEFPQETSVEEFLSDDNLKESSTGRRDFLKFLGFSVAAATVAACEAPVTKAIPYVNKPENVTPGMPTWYASTYYDGNNYASILVKTREGRPIYIKGNKDQGITKGGANAQIIASVLGLYDSSRLTTPQLKKGGEWEASLFSKVDKKVKTALKSANKVTLVSNSIISPSLMEAINHLSESLGGTRNEDNSITNDRFEHIQYDAVSYAAMREANKKTFGLEMNGNGIIPTYDFSKAHTIVSVGADFLTTWLMPTVFAGQYAETRNPDADWMSKHFQFEALMSITGSNADVRAMVKPSEYANVLAAIAKGLGVSVSGVSTKLSEKAQKAVNGAVKALKSSKKKSIVVCGSNNTALQILTNKINDKLGAYSETINTNEAINLFQSHDAKMNKFVSDVVKGKASDTVIFLNTNPVYTHPMGEKLGEALKKVKNKIAISSHADETANRCDMIIPDHHALEAWMDYNPTTSHYAIAQPTIRPLADTASSLESVLVWAGKASRGGKDSKVGYDFIQETWEQWGYTMDPEAQAEYGTFGNYWDHMVHASGSPAKPAAPTAPAFNDNALSSLSGKLPKGGGTEVVLYQKAGIGIGNQANNPWLQELPDPLTKITWDNYITMNPTEMEGMATTFDQESGLDLADLTIGGMTVTLPVYPLPGQAPGTVGVALGYGRGANGENIGTAAYQTKEYGGNVMLENGNPKPIGANVYPFVKTENGTLSYDASGAKVSPKGETYLVAGTQIHSTSMARHSIVRETTFDIYKKKDKSAYNPEHMLSKLDKDGNHVKAPVGEFDLWDAHPVENIGHRWGMTVDLSSCIGCSACLVACQSENNVPVVGKDEVRRGREMHWLRIDRYFATDVEAAVGTRTDEFDYHAAEVPAENPAVVHMPMMCHHCNHAPCETVCPVAATTHSNEGLNQMTYNRCIGTRYCANNCPYKVRRFNWFNYPSYKKFTEINPAQDDLGRMVLNPDVTVRTRGVMEKCSFCVQRIQAGKLEAKMDGRPVQDGDYTTACADACPTNAIIVGDWNDSESAIRKSAEGQRSYQALEEIGVKPNVWFKVKVRNEENSLLDKLQKEEAHHGGHEAEAGHGETEHGNGH